MCCKNFWIKFTFFVLTFMVSAYAANFAKQWSFANRNKVYISQTTEFPEEVNYSNEKIGSGTSTRGDRFLYQSELLSLKKVQLLSKPIAQYTNEARQNQIQGTVRLRATLSADGEVKNIVPTNILPFGLTEQAIAAANQIKFRPAFKNGKAISQIVVLEYNFTIY